MKRIFTSLLWGALSAFIFNSLAFHLFQRDVVEQVLLLSFSTAAFGYLIFACLETPPGNFLQDIKRYFSTFRFLDFVRENFPGLFITLLFWLIYFYIGLKLNPANLDTVDNFLDADNTSWMIRIAKAGGAALEMRGPHPFAYLIFRPLGFLLNLFTHNFALSAILLNTLTGALCVFLVWLYAKRQTQSVSYALASAGFLGLSTAHLFFGAVIETYIFSAFFLLLFFVFLQKPEGSLGRLVGVSVITFGLTFTNFVQTCIAFLVARPRLKEIVRFIGLTLSLSVILSLIHAVWYPSSKLFFLPSDAQTEGEFFIPIFQEPAWRVIGRITLLVRTIFLYTVVAPKPYVFMEEVGGTFPSFNFFKVVPGTFSYAAYSDLGKVLLLVWGAMFFLAAFFFVRDAIRARKFDVRLALILCVLFNFGLHTLYGYELFLYSPDWAYALILFTVISLQPLAKNRIFQLAFFSFLGLLAYQQMQFIEFILQTIAPFLK
ncbi:MAG: hypothetical protein IT310_01880 [Anaerolineales bacterium]|nr:hypothetical protein [Anaerolineales bacterium]